jgi:hypothetical protein
MNFLRSSRQDPQASGEGGGAFQDVDEIPDGAGVPIVTGKLPRPAFKVLQCGFTVVIDGEVSDAYRFQYAPVIDYPDDLEPGVIPAGLIASVTAKALNRENDTLLYLHTREGMQSLGPEYRVTYSTPQNVLVDWTGDIDGLWTEALGALEEHGELSEEGLDLLDADPLFLFGIADPSTQRQLERAASIPILKCRGAKPTIEEWAVYLNADLDADKEYFWVVQAFSEVELPEPWVSYKGVGSMVCYLNETSHETTWKHPFYDYFAQLFDHCKRSTREEHIKLRLNRMLWTYESECASSFEKIEPLVSPKYVEQMAELVGVDVLEEPYMVRTLKIFLKAFCQQYRLEEDLSEQEIRWSLDIVENERRKAEIQDSLKGKDINFPKGGDDRGDVDPMDPHVHKQVYCVECQKLATSFCIDCSDPFCEECFFRIHQKGQRRQHEFNYLSPCAICAVYPAKLQCTYSFGLFCHECYARKHVKVLPRYLDLKPVVIDYTKRGGAAGFGAQRTLPGTGANRRKEVSGYTLGEDWHTFFDLRGCPYYFNFRTREAMRRAEPAVTSDTKISATRAEQKERLLINLAQAKESRKLVHFSRKRTDAEKMRDMRRHSQPHETATEATRESTIDVEDE